MSHGLNKTLQMSPAKIESGLGYKSSQVRVQVHQSQVQVLSVQVQVQQKRTKSALKSKSGLEYYKSASWCQSNYSTSLQVITTISN